MPNSDARFGVQTRFWIKIVMLFLVTWLVFARSINNPFEFDDWHVVPQNPAVHHLGNIPLFFVDTAHFSILPANRDYRPIFLTSMALSWNLGKGALWPFHAVSITTHGLTAVWLFLILRIMFRRISTNEESEAAAEWGAFAGALLFAVHPLTSESVVYISSQSVALTGFFYLLSFLLFITVYGRSESEEPAKNARFVVVGSYFAYLGALLCKPIGITLMINLALWELILSPKPAAPLVGKPSLWTRFGQRWLKYIPFGVITVAYLWLRTHVADQVFALGNQARPLNHHYLTQTKALVLYYLKLALAPFGLNADIRYPISTSPLDPPVLLALALLALIAWVVFRLRSERTFVFWALWFPACLFITTYAVMLIQVVNEHRVYLSLVGICAIVGLGFFRFRESLPLRVSDSTVGRRSGKTFSTALLATVVIVFGVLTFGRCQVWSSSLTLWGDAATNGGTWRAHMNYGQALEAAGRGDEALAEFKKAVEMGPFAFAHSNLGLAHMRRGNFTEGIDHLRKSVELWPTSPEMHQYLARGLEQLGRLEEAEKGYRTALHLRPDYLLAHRSLAGLYERQGRLGDAVSHYQRVLELSPNATDVAERLRLLATVSDQQPKTNLGTAASPQIEIYLKLYSDDPKNTDTLFALAWEYHRLGQLEKCRAKYEELLALDQNHRQGSFNLGYMLLSETNEKDLKRAIVLFEKVLTVDPNYTEVLHHIATAYRKLGEPNRAEAYDRRYLEVGDHAELVRRSKERLQG